MTRSQTSPTLPVVKCAGVPITACTPREAAHEVIRRATTTFDRGIAVHLCNAYTLALADRDPSFKSVLARAALNFPDGQPVVWANRIRHRGLKLPRERVRGPSLFLHVFEFGQEVGLKHYLLGSTPEVLNRLERALRERFPRADIVGTHSPAFRELSDSERAEQSARIRASEAQVVWVGLGTPKQDHEVGRLVEELPAVHVAIGAAFDFVAGTKKEAPAWMQRHGIEWVYRLAREPRRLWRRYVLGGPRFVWAAFVNR